MKKLTSIQLKQLEAAFGNRLQQNVVLANYTTARIGGPADAVLIIQSTDEMVQAVQKLWDMNIHFHLLGNGSNVLVSDTGVRGLVLLNHAHNVHIDAKTEPPTALVEAGANLSGVTRQLALRGLSGMEWACGIPGTVGGAAYGNAGANGSDMEHSVILAEILHPTEGRTTWPVEKLEYQYRSSIMKRTLDKNLVILAVRFRLSQSTREAVQGNMDAFNTRRRSTQPPGASMGSMFKNPPGDYAGRLIESAGLKGTKIGDAMISPIHANFMINQGNATAKDVMALVQLVKKTVLEKYNVTLNLEIEPIGEW